MQGGTNRPAFSIPFTVIIYYLNGYNKIEAPLPDDLSEISELEYQGRPCKSIAVFDKVYEQYLR